MSYAIMQSNKHVKYLFLFDPAYWQSRRTRKFLKVRDRYDKYSDSALTAAYFELTARLQRRNSYVTFWTAVILVFVVGGLSNKLGAWFSSGALLLSAQSGKYAGDLADLTVKQTSLVHFFNLTLVLLIVVLVSVLFWLYLYMTSRLHWELLIVTSIKDKRKI